MKAIEEKLLRKLAALPIGLPKKCLRLRKWDEEPFVFLLPNQPAGQPSGTARCPLAYRVKGGIVLNEKSTV